MKIKFLSFGLIFLFIHSFAQEGGNYKIEAKFGYSMLSNYFNRKKNEEVNISFINGINSTVVIPVKGTYINLLLSGEFQFGQEYVETIQGWPSGKFQSKMNSAGIYLGLNIKNDLKIIGLNSNIALGYNHAQKLLFYDYFLEEDVIDEYNISSLGGFISVGPYIRIQHIFLYPAFYASFYGNKDLSGFYYGVNFSIGMELRK